MTHSQAWLLLGIVAAGTAATVICAVCCTLTAIETARGVRQTAASLSGVASEMTRVLQPLEPQSVSELVHAARCAANSTTAVAEQLRDALEESGKAWTDPGSDLANSVAKLFSRRGAR
jgi:hypothetical protein